MSNKELKDFESNPENAFRIYFVSQLSLKKNKYFCPKQTKDLWENFNNYHHDSKIKLILDSKMNLIENFTVTELGKIGITKRMCNEWKNSNKERQVNYNLQSPSLV